MPLYKTPTDHALFLLRDVFKIDRYSNHPAFAEVTQEVAEAILNGIGRLCEEVLLPLNQSGDREGCRLENGTVITPKGFVEAHRRYVEGGWMSISGDAAYGGQGLPKVFGFFVNEFTTSANMAFAMFSGLTRSASAALLAHAGEEQKQIYATKLISGEWLGTMNLTEPQCGTDLGLLRTKAVPQDDGSYRISGQKIFISAGEHDLTPNILHLVLARIEGAPAGTKGISLFLVPKMLVDRDGAPVTRNGVACGALEHKMGIHGSPTCVMNFEDAAGWLIGEANRGLSAMFVMMNEARMGVASQGLAMSEAAYQNAAAYAKERLQGRSLSGPKNPGGPADPILVHPDVRRMLLEIRAFNEAARALMVATTLQADLAHGSDDAAVMQAADDRLGLMTPVLKGVFTDMGFANCVKAQQVFGGHGYIAETGIEQLVRDSRIAMIYEGANGIQALDLVGRKLPKDGGRAFTTYVAEVAQVLKRLDDREDLAFCVKPMRTALGHLQQATMWFMQNALAKPDHAGAGSTDYMHMFGLVALGHMWMLMAEAVTEGVPSDRPALEPEIRLTLARVFMERMLPETVAHLARITAGGDALMALPAEAF